MNWFNFPSRDDLKHKAYYTVSPRILSLSRFNPDIPGDDFLNLHLQVLYQFSCNTQINKIVIQMIQKKYLVES